jgi:hypothetical protein
MLTSKKKNEYANIKIAATVTYREELLEILPTRDVIEHRHRVLQFAVHRQSGFPEGVLGDDHLWDTWRSPGKPRVFRLIFSNSS